MFGRRACYILREMATGKKKCPKTCPGQTYCNSKTNYTCKNPTTTALAGKPCNGQSILCKTTGACSVSNVLVGTESTKSGICYA